MPPTKTVPEIDEALERYHLLSSKELAAMRRRWFHPDRKEVDDPDKFRRWLVANHYVTEFVARVVSGRKSDQLVLNQYRLIDQLSAGPMAGAYLAIDALARRVAIEVLSPGDAADPAVLADFHQAATRAMQVHHPNVGRILDTGEAHGLHYLVKEYYEGQTLEDVFEQRRKLPYAQAAKLMALAFAGVEALHGAGVPAGDLKPDCIIMTAAGKDAKQRTVKILHAGVRRKMFDEAAIGRSISIVAPGGFDDLELATSTTFEVGKAGEPNRADDIFRLGRLFYQCVTGKPPYLAVDLPEPRNPAPPVCDVVPEVPEMLGEIIDDVNAPEPANRPRKAGDVAKALRVFLAADEESRETRAEEHIIVPRAAEAVGVPVMEVEEADDEDEEEPAPHKAARQPAASGHEGPWEKAVALWHEVRPEIRDLLFFASGGLFMLILILLGEVLTGLRMSYLAGLATGASLTYVVDLFVRWRRKREVATE